MKKLLSLFLVFALVFSLCSCQIVADILTELASEDEYFYVDYTTAPETTPKPEPTPDATPEPTPAPTPAPTPTEDEKLDKNGYYYSKEDVALYIHTYGCLPGNFITKNEARDLGWTGGSLERYAPGMCIGGDKFGNYEGLLPTRKGRKYTECDIDTLGKSSRGAKRIVFSDDGLIY